MLEALWDLVWAGEVTNDTLAPLRAFVAAKRRGARADASLPHAPRHPLGSGRWYLVRDLLAADQPIASEMKATAIAEQLLERHGVVTRDAVLAEGVPGGFSGLYPVFAAMEDAGQRAARLLHRGAGRIPVRACRARSTGCAPRRTPAWWSSPPPTPPTPTAPPCRGPSTTPAGPRAARRQPRRARATGSSWRIVGTRRTHRR